MELSARKKQILKAIIGDYIRTAEPIGSKTLTKDHALPFSSATIRNEMSELEALGLLEKPHTSAGRIPSSQGYRLYVDELMDCPEGEESDEHSIEHMLQYKVRELDRLIEQAAKLISSMTNYASVAVTPALMQSTIRKFEIIPVDKRTFVIVVVIDSGTVKSKMVHTMTEVTADETETLTYVLNHTLTAIPLTAITSERFEIVRRAAGLSVLLAPVAEYLAELIEELSDQKIYLEGTRKLLRFPEYQDLSKAQALLDYIEEDGRHLLPVERSVDGIQFFIGPENGENPLRNASTVYATYEIGKLGRGVIGVVGPTRMDYAALAARLSRFAKGLNRLIADTFFEEGER